MIRKSVPSASLQRIQNCVAWLMHPRVTQPSRGTVTGGSNPKDNSSLVELSMEQSQVLSLRRNSPSIRHAGITQQKAAQLLSLCPAPAVCYVGPCPTVGQDTSAPYGYLP